VASTDTWVYIRFTTFIMIRWLINSLRRIECTSWGLSVFRFDMVARKMLRKEIRTITRMVMTA
jgi:hypothetical protein